MFVLHRLAIAGPFILALLGMSTGLANAADSCDLARGLTYAFTDAGPAASLVVKPLHAKGTAFVGAGTLHLSDASATLVPLTVHAQPVANNPQATSYALSGSVTGVKVSGTLEVQGCPAAVIDVHIAVTRSKSLPAGIAAMAVGPVSDPSHVVPVAVVRPTTVMIDQTDIGNIQLDATDPTVLVLPPKHPLRKAIQPGTVLAFGVTTATPEGLLRKVVSVGPNSVVVAPASLSEAFDALNVRLDSAPTAYPAALEARSASGCKRGQICIPVTAQGTLKGDHGDISVAAGVYLDLGGEVGLDGSGPWADVYGDFGAGVDLTATESLDLKTGKDGNKIGPSYTSPPVEIGGIPVTAKLQLKAGGECKAQGTLEAHLGANLAFDVSCSLDGCDIDSSLDPTSSLIVDANVDCKAWVGPEVKLFVFDPGANNDIFISPRPYLHFHGDINDNPWWALYGGVDANVGIDVGGFTPVDEYFTPVGDREITSAHGPFPCGIPGTTCGTTTTTAPPRPTSTTSTTRPIPTTTTTTLPPPPMTPTGLRVTGRTTSSISLAWNAAPGVGWYDVVTVKDGTQIQQQTTPGTNKGITISGLDSNTSYTFRLRAVGSGGVSGTANVSANTLATFRANVKQVTITGDDGRAIDLAHLRPAQRAWVSVTAINSGSYVWTNSGPNPVRIATVAPRNRDSAFAASGWLAPSRPATLDQAIVRPLETGTFHFMMVAPQDGNAKYSEPLNFVSELQSWFETPDFDITATVIPIVGIDGTPAGDGYWRVAADGGVFTFGNAVFYGSMGATPLSKPMVGIAATPSGHGYWLVAADGGIFNFGDAAFYGSTGNQKLNKPVVGMAATPSGHGYWLVAADGGIFNFGDAAFYGSTGNQKLNKPVVGMAATPSGHGYWLVAADGGIFNFGDAAFYGSTGNKVLNEPVVGMTTTPSGHGYRLVAADGGVFSFGDAAFLGSLGDTPLDAPIVGTAAVPNGYWMIGSNGTVFPFNGTRTPAPSLEPIGTTSGAACGHVIGTGFGPLMHCHGGSGTSEVLETVSTLSCGYTTAGTFSTAKRVTYAGPSIANDGSGTFEFFGGPQVSTVFGPASFGEQRRTNGLGPLVRWGSYNFITNRFYPDNDWMEDLGASACQQIHAQ